MFMKALQIARLHITLTVQQRQVFLFSLLMPIIFTALMGQADFAGLDDRGGAHRLNVLNRDEGSLGKQFVDQLKATASLEVNVVDKQGSAGAAKGGDPAAELLIPANFSRQVESLQQTKIEFRGSSGVFSMGRSVEESVRAALAEFSGGITAHRVVERVAGRLGISDKVGQQSDEPAATDDLIALHEDKPGAEAAAARGVSQSSPGMLVMFALLFTVTGTNLVIWEKQLGTLRRLLVLPLDKAAFLIGKLSGIYFLGLIQLAVLVLAGVVLFRVNWGRSPTALLLIILSFEFTATSLGAVLATFAKTDRQANALASLVIMAISALGGAWWPLDITPPWMRMIGRCLPTAWALGAFQDTAIRGLGVAAILPQAGLLLGLGAVCLFIAISRFHYEA